MNSDTSAVTISSAISSPGCASEGRSERVRNTADEARAGERRGQEAHEGQPELDRGQETRRLRHEPLDTPRAAIALLDQLLEARAADAHERELGGHEQAVEEDQDRDDQDFHGQGLCEPSVLGAGHAAAHGCARARRRRACRAARPW